MKTLLAFAIILISNIATANNPLVISPQDSTNYQTLINDIESNGQARNYERAFQLASQLARTLHRDLRVNELVAKLSTKMTKVVDEVVTQKHHSEENQKVGLSLSLFIFGSANYNGSRAEERNWDTTKMITRNPEEEAEFNSRASSEAQVLEEQVKDYVNSNWERILLMKEAGQKAFEMAYQAKKSGQPTAITSEDIEDIAEAVTDINFLGHQQVTTCVETNYANRFSDDREDKSDAASGTLLFFSASASQEFHSYNSTQQLAHTERSCSSTTNSVELSSGDRGLIVDFTLVDRQLLSWKKIAVGAYVLSLNHGYVYPTFGNSFFQ